ncbi:MAG: hypothetical protein JNJ71_04960 [Rubrivivax sp.]|nr:hypothetical protein [Rubrivivax sp.]
MSQAAPVSSGGWTGAWLSLLASSSTLVCCALPALLVTLGAGAELSSLVFAIPQLVWIRQHRDAVFLAAMATLSVSTWLQWRNRNAPCPIDPARRMACVRTRRWSARLQAVSWGVLAIGGFFAFLLPLI